MIYKIKFDKKYYTNNGFLRLQSNEKYDLITSTSPQQSSEIAINIA